ncbi:MAG: hypothetical protein ACHQ7M_14720 [Chloroflexota bacterium]
MIFTTPGPTCWTARIVCSSVVPPDAAAAALEEADAGTIEAGGFAAAELAGAEALGLPATDAAEGLVDAEAATDGAGVALDAGAAPVGAAAVPAWPQAARTRGRAAGSRMRFNIATTIKQKAFRDAS